MFRGLWLGLIAWAGAVVCAAADTPPPSTPPATDAASASIEAFIRPPALRYVAISPTGRWLATIEANGDGQAVYVTEVKTGARKKVAFSSSEHVGFDWVSWKNDDRLMFKAWLFHIYRRGDKPKADVIAVKWGSFLEAVDPDGKNLVILFKDNPSGVRRSSSRVTMIDRMDSDSTHILVSAPNGRGQLSVWKADLATGVAELQEIGDWNTIGWLADSAGQVVVREEWQDGGDSYQARSADGWSEFARSRSPQDGELAEFEVFGPTPNKGEFYVAAKGQGQEGRYVGTYDVLKRKPGERQGPALSYDVDHVVLKGETRQLAGICHEEDRMSCDFRDAGYGADFKFFAQQMRGPGNVDLVSATKSDRIWIMSVSAPNHPTGFYLFDRDRRSLTLIGDSHPDLPASRLGVTEPYHFRTRDGVEIVGYLTRPPGAKDGPLPMVVMPHGGPEARDSWDYDPTVQLLAARGYLVFQPNFRGSGGFGAAFAEAGYRQWGLRMQDDVTDGVGALVKAGLADPMRMCIFGASYGGYAALQAGATTDLYHCVISMSGPSDLNVMLDWEKKQGGGANTDRYLYWRKAIGDPDKDHAKLAAASPITHAKDFGPPVLLIHGSIDATVPVEQSKIMETALRHAGKQVKLVILDDEAHGGFNRANSRIAYAAIVDFLAQHLGPGAG